VTPDALIPTTPYGPRVEGSPAKQGRGRLLAGTGGLSLWWSRERRDRFLVVMGEGGVVALR
jgi:hypothetical protein